MFTGIIEGLGKVLETEQNGGNLELWIQSPFNEPLKIDQSISHNGACLTVVEIKDQQYRVTAIEETLQKTNLASLKKGMFVNLERCLKVGDRLDGHMVQGHVDTVGTCVEIDKRNGSTNFFFEYHSDKYFTVEKGSITINGVSLTVVHAERGKFSVSIIPYTLEHTTFKHLKVGDKVNLEFDIIGKYLAEMSKGYLKA